MCAAPDVRLVSVRIVPDPDGHALLASPGAGAPFDPSREVRVIIEGEQRVRRAARQERNPGECVARREQQQLTLPR